MIDHLPPAVRTDDGVYELNVISLQLSSRRIRSGLMPSLIQIIDAMRARAERHSAAHLCPELPPPSPCQAQVHNSAGRGFTGACTEKVPSAFGIMLGKGDVCVFSNAANEVLACDLRQDLHSARGVRSIFAFPALRLIDPGSAIRPLRCAAGHPMRHCSLLTERSGNIVFFTAVRLELDQPRRAQQPLVGPDRLIDAVSGIFRLRQGLEATVCRNGIESSPRLDGYLTLSDYRLLIKIETPSYKEACSLLSSIREHPLIHSTSTQVCLPFHDPREITGWREMASGEDEPFPVGVLARARSGASANIATALRQILSQSPACCGEPQVMLRHGYWDYLMLFPTRSLHAVAHCVLNEILRVRGILGTRVVPYLETESLGEAVFLERSVSQGPAALPPLRRRCAPRAPLVQEVQDAAVHLRWIKNRLSQLNIEWRRCHSLPENVTIARLQQRLQAQLDELRFALKAGGRSQDQPQAVTDLLPSRSATISMLETLRRARALKRGAMPMTEALVGLYNERLEGNHVAAVAEPISRIGERAGVFELVHTAIDRLMTDLCGQARPGVPFHHGEAGPRVNPETVTRGWKGLVSTNGGLDFGVDAELQYLTAPVDFKLSASGNLLPLAHEAAHVLEYSLLRGEVKTDQHRGVWAIERCLKQALECVLQSNDSEIAWSFAWLNSQARGGLGRLGQEMLIDIWAYLIGGPLYALSHWSQDTLDVVTASDGFRELPPELLPRLRISIGLALGKRLRWHRGWMSILERIDAQAARLESIGVADLDACHDIEADEHAWLKSYLLAQRKLCIFITSILKTDHLEIINASIRALKESFLSTASPLFFPDGRDEDGRQLRHIQEIARRLHRDQELVLDCRPRDLISATALLDAEGVTRRWRTSPCLRTFLSIVYTEGGPARSPEPQSLAGTHTGATHD